MFFYDILKIEKQINVFAGDFITNGIILNHDVFHYFSGKIKGDAEFGIGTAECFNRLQNLFCSHINQLLRFSLSIS